MNKKSVQEERMRGYFITAAMELIRAEGIGVVSARNVADRAGYSYATLYNYFRDIRDLVFSCVEGFMAECREFVGREAEGSGTGADGIEAITRGYVKFFVQYPGIFDLLYEQKPSDMATSRSDLAKISSFFDTLTEKGWKAARYERGSNIETARKVHARAVHGLLLFFLKRRSAGGYEQLLEEIADLHGLILS